MTKRNFKKCPICERNISFSNYSRHIEAHKRDLERKKPQHLDHNDLFCKYCKNEFKNKNSLLQHEIRCKKNPNRYLVSFARTNSYARA